MVIFYKIQLHTITLCMHCRSCVTTVGGVNWKKKTQKCVASSSVYQHLVPTRIQSLRLSFLQRLNPKNYRKICVFADTKRKTLSKLQLQTATKKEWTKLRHNIHLIQTLVVRKHNHQLSWHQLHEFSFNTFNIIKLCW